MDNVICIDSSILIDHFRSKNKERTFFEKVHREYRIHCIPAIAKYEVLAGVADEHLEHWMGEFRKMLFLPLTEPIVMEARSVALQLKRKGITYLIPQFLFRPRNTRKVGTYGKSWYRIPSVPLFRVFRVFKNVCLEKGVE